MHFKTLAVWAAVLLFGAAGCRQRQKEEVTLEDIVPPARTVVESTAPKNGQALRNSYVTLVAQQTKGLFPCALAVARVTPVAAGVVEPDVEFNLNMDPLNELVDWMSLFDDTWLISEVFPVTYPIRKDRRIALLEIVEYAHQDDARLCLIYSVSRSETSQGSSSEVQGMLYDTETGMMLARTQADQFVLALTEDQLPPPPPPDRVETDHRHFDPVFIAQDRFRELLRRCVLELIAQDQRVVVPPQMHRRAVLDLAPHRRSPSRDRE